MALYRYKAVTPVGETQEGELEGATPEAVVLRLQEMNLIPIRVALTHRDISPKSESRASTLISWRVGRPKVTQDDVAILTQELSTLLKAGLPLDRTLEILIGLSGNEAVRALLMDVREDVRAGSALSAALEARGPIFGRFYLNMVRAGEAGGALDVVLQRLSEFMERAKELRETVKSALIYPAILVGVSVLSVALLLVWVVPQFTQMFEESGKALPVPTQIVIAVGDWVRGYWWAMVLAVGGAYIGMQRRLEDADFRLRWDRWLLRLPLIGDLIGKLEVARLTRTLGTLIGNGVALLTALAIVKETLGNAYMAHTLTQVSAELKEGKGLGGPLMETGVFPRLAVHLIQVGEETGKLQDMLLRIADIYDREVHAAVKRMLGLMEPLLILGLGLVIGGIIMSILVAVLSVNDLTL